MKLRSILCSILTAGLLAGCETESKSELQSQAKITKEEAQATALSKAPNGTVKEAELEREHGKLIWSFDIAIPGAKDITEVNVNAITGEIVNVEHEKAEKGESDEKEGKEGK